MLTTAGGCCCCICFQTRNSAPPAIPTIAIATSGQTTLRAGFGGTICACGIDIPGMPGAVPIGCRLTPLLLDSEPNGGGVTCPVNSLPSWGGRVARISSGVSVIVESTAGNSSSSSSSIDGVRLVVVRDQRHRRPRVHVGLVDRGRHLVAALAQVVGELAAEKSPISPCDHGRLSVGIASSTALAELARRLVPVGRIALERVRDVAASTSGTSGR